MITRDREPSANAYTILYLPKRGKTRKYVVRHLSITYWLDGDLSVASTTLTRAWNIDDARDHFAPGEMTCYPRAKGDHRCVIETWI